MKLFRWNLFGHVLRLQHDTPAQQAMDYNWGKTGSQGWVEEDGSVSAAPRGRPITTLPVLLWRELKEFCLKEKEIYSTENGKINHFQKAVDLVLKAKPRMELILSELRSLAEEKEI